MRRLPVLKAARSRIRRDRRHRRTFSKKYVQPPFCKKNYVKLSQKHGEAVEECKALVSNKKKACFLERKRVQESMHR